MELVDEAMTIVGQTSSHRHGGGGSTTECSMIVSWSGVETKQQDAVTAEDMQRPISIQLENGG